MKEEIFGTSVDEKIPSERSVSCINVGRASVQLTPRGCLLFNIFSLICDQVSSPAHIWSPKGGTKVFQAPRLTLAARRPQVGCGVEYHKNYSYKENQKTELRESKNKNKNCLY